MANPRKRRSPTADRHKPARLIRVKPPLAEQLDVLAERNTTSTTAEANRAIRELLEREKLWPRGG
jgi:predicted transcriptional regulator